MYNIWIEMCCQQIERGAIHIDDALTNLTPKDALKVNMIRRCKKIMTGKRGRYGKKYQDPEKLQADLKRSSTIW